jgi:2'-5' RNA ligase
MRLFTAVELPAATRARIAAFGEDLFEGVGGGVRRVPPENLHVTVHFLGSVPEQTLPRVLEALDAATAMVAPGTADLRGVGAFPKASRPSVVWAGVGDAAPSGALHRLHQVVTDALCPLGYPAEERPYRPHVTLIRVNAARVNSGRGSSREQPRGRRAPVQLIERLRALREEPPPEWGRLPVEHLTLFSSTFEKPTSSGSGGPGGRGGPRYERIAHFALRGHAGEDSRVATGSERH